MRGNHPGRRLSVGVLISVLLALLPLGAHAAEEPGAAAAQDTNLVQVDLGTGVRVGRVVLKLPTTWEASTQRLAVLGSTDGSAFTALAAPADRTFTPAQASTVTLTLDGPTTRCLRVQVSANSGWSAAQLSELEVYGDGGPGDPPTQGTNLACNKPVEVLGRAHTASGFTSLRARTDYAFSLPFHHAVLSGVPSVANLRPK
ncbi:discoidin domain-containing protein [Streptomyces sp. NPDC053367]|uniref:discoidin domain-containing protein n=1 Tax=Streptomyces sp. NPDC053367 TaxID=3365700 RepID=UPI0037D7BA0A